MSKRYGQIALVDSIQKTPKNKILKIRTGFKSRETEQSRSLESLHYSEGQYRLMFDSNPHPMWVYDIYTLQFLAVNNAAINHYGYSREEFLNMTLIDIRPESDVSNLVETVSRS